MTSALKDVSAPRPELTRGRVLVTGASGFVGRQVVPQLIAAGHDVHVIGRSAAGSGSPSAPEPGASFHAIDLLDAANFPADAIARIGADRLLHIAWCATPGVYWTSLDNLRWVSASIRLIDAFLLGGGARFVGVGTCAEYDWSYSALEEGVTPLRPTTLYGECKASLHKMMLAAAERRDFSVAWAHIFHPYGPHEKDGRLLSEVIKNLLRGRVAPCSDGWQVRDLMHVQDVAGALVALVDSDVEGSVNVASGVARPVREAVLTAARLIGRPELVQFGARPLAANDPPCLAAVTRRLTEEIGYKPKFDLDLGIADTIDWWDRTLRLDTATLGVTKL